MKINPERFRWKAPENNQDGTPIDYELDYELGLMNEDGEIVPFVVIPEKLQDNEYYTAEIEQFDLDAGQFEFAIRSFAANDRDRKSQWSETVEFAISDRIPSLPLEFSVE